MSMVEHWQDVAIANLRDAGEWYPGRFRRITTRIVNKAALQTQRTLNFGSGAKMVGGRSVLRTQRQFEIGDVHVLFQFMVNV